MHPSPVCTTHCPGEGIKVNTCLEDLLVNGNSVGDDGARHLMHALKFNNTLQYLGLQVGRRC